MTQCIDGQWLNQGGASFESTAPYDGQTLWQGFIATDNQVDAAVNCARDRFSQWRQTSFEQRCAIVEQFAQLLEAEREPFANIIAQETGKPLWESRTEVTAMLGKVAISIRAYHERTGFQDHAQGVARRVLRHRPHGVLAVLGPYNFPGHLPNGHIIPALLAGNTVVFKPSEQTPWCGEQMVRLWHQAGLPAGVLNLVQGDASVGQALMAHSQLDGLLFTGSSLTGAALHQHYAAQTGKLLALEMGGNNPLICSEDYGDLDAAVNTILQSAFLSGGQRCTCARRLYLPNGSSGDAILERLIEVAQRLVIDTPFSLPEPFYGALISPQAAQRVLTAQSQRIAAGGRALLTARLCGQAMLTPSIIEMSDADTFFDEEVFGPLLQVFRYHDLAQAVTQANATRFGLSAGLISQAQPEWDYFLENSRAGIVNRNQALTGASSESPFGGIGASGNLRPSAYYAADYCAYPVASLEADCVTMPAVPIPGVVW
ncbi:succinylglutamate-semialdehyde dehydrogenase [Vibrio sp. SM6]|uniref:N-succinylglutamate 5-semialdehyde dehydrogenase n=1 Tax=Vibrio agarilyticus TaxID=2726741 RepID=A0A7X8TU53_9VIBR|nr:succinylglutamate-semialdehyde dehydrogenase [Vibrio agarilyticus]NLS14671.1 succinylglutamate-semialdehyde dehydrogenase [Vibrio agarilyticus]